MSSHIENAGNTTVPVVLTLRAKGYSLRWERKGATPDGETWFAVGPAGSFSSDDPVSLLGLIAMREHRGPDWKAADDEIDAFLSEYDAECG